MIIPKTSNYIPICIISQNKRRGIARDLDLIGKLHCSAQYSQLKNSLLGAVPNSGAHLCCLCFSNLQVLPFQSSRLLNPSFSMPLCLTATFLCLSSLNCSSLLDEPVSFLYFLIFPFPIILFASAFLFCLHPLLSLCVSLSPVGILILQPPIQLFLPQSHKFRLAMLPANSHKTSVSHDNYHCQIRYLKAPYHCWQQGLLPTEGQISVLSSIMIKL